MGVAVHAREPLRGECVRHPGSRSAGRGKRLLARGGAPRRHHPQSPQSRQCPQKTLRA